MEKEDLFKEFEKRESIKQTPEKNVNQESFEKKEVSFESKREKIKEYLEDLDEKAPHTPISTRDELNEIKILPSIQQIGVLISLVFDKGLPEAIAIAKKLENPAVLDEFHDILIQRYDELVEKGIIKKV